MWDEITYPFKNFISVFIAIQTTNYISEHDIDYYHDIIDTYLIHKVVRRN